VLRFHNNAPPNRILIREKDANAMTKNTLKSLLLTAAMTGLMTGATTSMQASTSSNSGVNSLTSALGASANFDGKTTEKHACKGLNSCKGKGGCATDGSNKPKAV